ncbi:hypothetical protein F5Y13DRAFT_170709 [Hypoxylon sp. FL1857]|nr:hypothetical protein F5Y13DRAFT_170709 [Hypoxylon sp. FL1857]
MEESAGPLPAALEPISRPSSTSSTTASVAQLPGVSALAAAGSATSSPQLRATNAPVPLMNPGSSPAAHAPTASGNLVSRQDLLLLFLLFFPPSLHPFLGATRKLFPCPQSYVK